MSCHALLARVVIVGIPYNISVMQSVEVFCPVKGITVEQTVELSILRDAITFCDVPVIKVLAGRQAAVPLAG